MFNALNEPQGGCPQTAVLFIDERCRTTVDTNLLVSSFYIYLSNIGPSGATKERWLQTRHRGGPESRDKTTI